MHIETKRQSHFPRPRRRTVGERLIDALGELTGGEGELLQHEQRNWASITFAGTRHRLRFAFAGEEAVEAGESFIAFLPEHEFAIPGQIVADATVTSVDHRLDPPLLAVDCELLLLEED